MNGRIGELAIEYRTTAGHALAPGLTPAIDRAIRAGLGEALEQELAALDVDRTVIVIRTLRADVAIGPADLKLDRRCVERIGRATAQAMGATLAVESSDDDVKRFSDQADFVSSYIVDVLFGTSDRWYYGAFKPFDAGSPEQRISAVLSQHRDEAGHVFGRLARRGRLDQVLALLGATAMRDLASTRRLDDAAPPDVSALADAAIDVLSSIGWPIDTARRRMVHDLAVDRRTAPAPAWIDRRELSRWVWQLADLAIDRFRRDGVSAGPADAEATRVLLHGKLDWLDTAWLEPRLNRLGDAATDASSDRNDVAESSAAMARIASRLREGRLWIDRSASRDTVAVQLLAAAHASLEDDERLDSSDAEALERIADAWELLAPDTDSLQRVDRMLGDRQRDRHRADETLPTRLIAVQACGPAAVDVLRAAIVASQADADRGVATEGGGLYLMTRALLDVRFDAIVRDAGLPLGSVLAGLAAAWCGQRGPFDPAIACWCAGDESPALLDAHIPALQTIEAQLRERLAAQKAIAEADEIEQAAVDSTNQLVDAAATRSALVVEHIADLLMHAWQRWLPGLSSSSPSYVVANCLKRRAYVRIDDHEVRVLLESAPFDVVLEMAGYLRPIEHVAWLDRRRVTFDVARTPTA